jgi:DeoR/GlpR family transcriptional regulator of sugar metabolism
LLSQKPIGPLTVVTNNIPVAETLGGIADVEVQLPAGRFLARQSVLLGGPANRSLNFWNFDLAFLSAEGFDRAGIWNTNADVVAFQRAVMARARQAYFLVDHSKLGRATRDAVASWAEPVRLITDTSVEALRGQGIRLARGRLVSA